MPPQWTKPLLNITLRSGSVYYLQHRNMTSPEPHYFVVLNSNPSTSEFLVLLVASSRVDKVKRRRNDLPASTLVEITPADYSEFSQQSIIDCNQCFRFSRQELLNKLQQRVATEKTPMPKEVVKKLREGIIVSPLIENEIKDMVS